MKIKVDLEWYCLNWNFNDKKPEFINIMRVIKPDEIAKMIKYKGAKPNKWNSIKTYAELKDYLKRQFMYYFWSKAECEILVTGFLDNDKPYKIDIWSQIEPNLDIITKYIINKMDIEEVKYVS